MQQLVLKYNQPLNKLATVFKMISLAKYLPNKTGNILEEKD